MPTHVDLDDHLGDVDADEGCDADQQNLQRIDADCLARRPSFGSRCLRSAMSRSD